MKFINPKNKKIIKIPKRAKVQRLILETLIKHGTLSTPELEEITGCNCYGACRSLEEKNLVYSGRRKDYTLWDPITGQVVTKENYDAIMKSKTEAKEKLRKIYGEQGLSDHEIEEKLEEVISPKAMGYTIVDWWLNHQWDLLKE